MIPKDAQLVGIKDMVMYWEDGSRIKMMRFSIIYIDMGEMKEAAFDLPFAAEGLMESFNADKPAGSDLWGIANDIAEKVVGKKT